MAVPLRKAAGAYEAYALPDRDYGRQSGRGRAVKTAPKRLVRRQIRSNAETRRTAAWLFFGLAFLFFTMGLSYTFVNAGVSRLNYDINTLRAENEKITLENDKVRGEIAELRSLDRIEEIAVRDLGMVKNETVQYAVMSSTVEADGMIRRDTAEQTGPAEAAEGEESGFLARAAGFFRGLMGKTERGDE